MIPLDNSIIVAIVFFPKQKKLVIYRESQGTIIANTIREGHDKDVDFIEYLTEALLDVKNIPVMNTDVNKIRFNTLSGQFLINDLNANQTPPELLQERTVKLFKHLVYTYDPLENKSPVFQTLYMLSTNQGMAKIQKDEVYDECVKQVRDISVASSELQEYLASQRKETTLDKAQMELANRLEKHFKV